MQKDLPERKLRLVESALFREIDEQETCLLDTESKSFFSVNQTGLLILEQLKQGRTQDQIIAAVAEQFKVETQDCSTDVAAFLDELRGAGLIERDP